MIGTTTARRLCQHGTAAPEPCKPCGDIADAAQAIQLELSKVARMIREFTMAEDRADWREQIEEKAERVDSLEQSFESISEWAQMSAEGRKGWKR